MIIDIPSTTAQAVAKQLVRIRDEGGAVALGRVLTLIILPSDNNIEEAISAANDASREHPCRVIVLAPASGDADRLDAEIRVGGDAGASEVIVLRPSGLSAADSDTLVVPLLLSDTPIVVWWPGEMPADPASDPIGAMAQARITDSLNTKDPRGSLALLRTGHDLYSTDLAWTRLTVWRGLLAATLDQPPYEPVTSITVEGNAKHPSVDLLAGWLSHRLKAPVTVTRSDEAQAVSKVILTRASGETIIDRPHGAVAQLIQPGQPTHRISLPIRTLRECLAEELRRLDPDEVYADTLTKGLDRLPEWKEAR